MDVSDKSTPTVNLGRLSGDLGFLLRLAQLKVYEQYFRQCGDPQVKPGEFSVLWAIANNPGIRQSLLCQHLIIKRSHMTKLARSLEDRGLVSRRVPDDDRRGVELTLTERGKTMVEEAGKWFFAFEDSLGAELGEPDRSQFISLLLRFIAGADAAPEVFKHSAGRG